MQEHRSTYTEDIKYHDTGNGWTLATVAAWKNSVNATVGGVGMLIGPRSSKTLNRIVRIQPRMMAATFNGNPRATIISCYSPTNVSEETELVAFYDELSSLVYRKHNVLVIRKRYECPNRKKTETTDTAFTTHHKIEEGTTSNRIHDGKEINMPQTIKKGRGKIMDLHIREQ